MPYNAALTDKGSLMNSSYTTEYTLQEKVEEGEIEAQGLSDIKFDEFKGPLEEIECYAGLTKVFVTPDPSDEGSVSSSEDDILRHENVRSVIKDLFVKKKEETLAEDKYYFEGYKIADILYKTQDFDDLYEPQGTMDVAFEQFNVFGKLKKFPQMATVSKIVKSRLHNTYCETDLQPAMLRPKGDIDPMVQALKKYCRNNALVDEKLFARAAVSWLRHSVEQQHDEVRPRILTIWEAVYGIEGDPYFKGIPKHTSSGYPMNMIGVEDMKEGLYPPPSSKNRCDCPDHKFWQLTDLVNIDLELMKNGIRPFYAFNDFLKDELRPAEKARKGKTRLISGSPFIYSIICKMYNSAFDVNMMLNKIDNGCCVGINPYSDDWQQLTRYLSVFSNSAENTFVGAGDYSGFDAGQLSAMHMAVLLIYQQWYAWGNMDAETKAMQAQIREILWLEVTNPKHVNNGVLYEWVGAFSSGHTETVNINCLVNNILFRVCWFCLVGEHIDFNYKVRLCTYGDDCIYAVHPEFQSVFNDITLQDQMAEFGMVFTTESKEAAVVGFRRITEVEFLKRGFYFHPMVHQWLAPLRLDVVLNIPMWTKKGTYKDDIVADNVVVAIRELSLHPSEVFDMWRPLILKQFKYHYFHHNVSAILLKAQTDVWMEIKDDFRSVSAPDEIDLEKEAQAEVLDYVLGVDLFH